MEETHYLARGRVFVAGLVESGKQSFQQRFPDTYAHLPYYLFGILNGFLAHN